MLLLCVCMLSCVRFFEAPWTVACQAPLPMEFSRQEHWSGLPFPSPGDLPDPGIEPALLHLLLWHVDSLLLAWMLFLVWFNFPKPLLFNFLALGHEKYARIILYIFCSRSGISHSFKRSWSLLVKTNIERITLIAIRLLLLLRFSADIEEKRNNPLSSNESDYHTNNLIWKLSFSFNSKENTSVYPIFFI